MRDLTYALRSLRKSPLFTATAILVLTLGIGANTAIFAVINAVLLKPLPFAEADRLVQLVITTNGVPAESGASPARYLFWREQADVLEDVAAYRSIISLDYTMGDIPESVVASQVTASYFRTFRAPFAFGGPFTAEEDLPGAAKTVVVSHDFWSRRLGGSPDVIGKAISLSAVPYTVVGVAAPEFDAPELGDADVWVPLQIDAAAATDDNGFLKAAARLKPGVSLEQAQARLESLMPVFRERFATGLRDDSGFSVVLFADAIVATGVDSVLFRNEPRGMLWLLFGAVGFVLLIACANVASLMIMRASARDRDIAVRASLGASRWQIARQLLAESTLLSVAGGALGLLLGFAAIRVLLAVNTGGLPRVGEGGTLLAMDWRVVGFTAALSIVAALVFGVLPALVASRGDLNAVINHSGGRSGVGSRKVRGRSILVAAEVGLSVVLLIGAALLIRTTLGLYSVNPGFNVDDVVVMRTSLAEKRFHDTATMQALSTSTLERIRAIPNVAAAGATCCVPLSRSWGSVFKIVGRDDGGRAFTSGGDVTISTGDYFDVFEIPLLRGRAFNERDEAGSPPVIVINRALAERWWPDGQDPLGARLQMLAGNDDPIREVIGVVENERKARLDLVRPTMYLPLAQISDAWLDVNLETAPLAWIVRANVDPMQLVAPIRDEIRRATGVSVTGIEPMAEIVSASISRQRASMLLMTVFGGVALLLAAIGIYGLVAFSVQQRTHEIGIRIALGAQRDRIVSMVIRQGMLLVAIGTGSGLAAAFFLADVLSSVLFGVQPKDVAVFVTVPSVLLLVGTLAVAIPALRASRVNPLEALRYE